MRISDKYEHEIDSGKLFTSREKKLQSAMEYLMTYGWAILIIAVVLVALFQMGVFNSANFAPKAQPGSCQVFRTTAATSLEGTCNNELPQYVAQFNGASSNINVGSGGSLTIGTGSATVSAWIMPNANADNNKRGIYSVSAGTGLIFAYKSNGGNNLYVEAYDGVNNPYGYSSVSLPVGVFSYVVITRAGGIFIFYINGVAGGTVSDTTGNLANGGPIIIGEAQGSSSNIFNGLIANVQIYNTSLSANDVAALYYEGIGGAPQNTQNLVGWWPLNGNANDYSGNNNNGAATNVIYTGSWASAYSAP